MYRTRNDKELIIPALEKTIHRFSQIDIRMLVDYLISDINLTIKVIEKFPNVFLPSGILLSNILLSSKIPISYIKEHLEFSWAWSYVSVDLDFAIKHPELNINWSLLSQTVTELEFDQNRNHPLWDMPSLSKNENISIKYIIKNKDLPWSWYAVSERPDLTSQDILDNPDIIWYINAYAANRQHFDINLLTRYADIIDIRIIYGCHNILVDDSLCTWNFGEHHHKYTKSVLVEMKTLLMVNNRLRLLPVELIHYIGEFVII